MLFKDKIRQAYVRALTEHFDLDRTKVDKSVHIGADGNWDTNATLEIHCEGEVPNASDYHNMADYGFPEAGYYCNGEQWSKVDKLANEIIRSELPRSPKYGHEVYNGGVVCVYEQ